MAGLMLIKPGGSLPGDVLGGDSTGDKDARTELGLVWIETDKSFLYEDDVFSSQH